MRIRMDASLPYDEMWDSIIDQMKQQGIKFSREMEAFYRTPMIFPPGVVQVIGPAEKKNAVER